MDKHRIIMIVILSAFLLSVCFFDPTSSEGRTYVFTYMNITVDGDSVEGFVQMFVYSKKNIGVRVKASKNNFKEYEKVGEVTGAIYNATEDFSSNQVFIESENSSVDSLGVAVFSSGAASVIGVKSDRGSTDAFLVLPVVRSSKEFMVAIWPNTAYFQGSIQIIGAQDGTCVEVYKVFGGTKFVLAGSESINLLQVYRFFQDHTLNEDGSSGTNLADLTGYYVNASRPVQVIVGHECANVPVGVRYCDYMSEQIPSIDQLGTHYVVPPIAGRLPEVGYIIRVVAAQKGGVITVKTSTGKQKDLKFGEFLEEDITKNSQAVVVTCSSTCLVMQYNKGYLAGVTFDTLTDPFMMMPTPSNRFTDESTFATPSYCDDDKKRVEFANYISIVTYTAYQNDIYYDEVKVTGMLPNVNWQTIDGFSFISFNITNGFHVVNSFKGSFAAYVYGHSIISSSTSGYGFASNYNITGVQISEYWDESAYLLAEYLLNTSSAECNVDAARNGYNVSIKPHATYPLSLLTEFQPVDMSDSCLSVWQDRIKRDFENLRQKLNFWLCINVNCTYLTGYQVALGSYSLSFLRNSQGKAYAVQLSVDVMATYDITSMDFATCRLELNNYIMYFFNWPSKSIVFTQGSTSDCPNKLTFKQYQFANQPSSACKPI